MFTLYKSTDIQRWQIYLVLRVIAGHLVASMLFGINEIELQYAKERQAVGIAVARKRGMYIGRKNGIIKAKSECIRELIANGLTITEIANALNISKRTIFRS